MRRVCLFVEDYGHEVFLRALLERLAQERQLRLQVVPRSVRGGKGRVLTELGQFLGDVRSGREAVPDLLVVATDANCKGYAAWRKKVETVTCEYEHLLALAIPDPHLERWLLLDSKAFKKVLGKGCSAPDQKCDKNRYKDLLRQACLDAGVTPLVGGLEHARRIVNAMDLDHLAKSDESLGKFLAALNGHLAAWR